MTTAMLLLADGRFPAGGHVHSSGIEAAVADGRVFDLGSLEPFVAGRVRTAGLTDAALAAATVHHLRVTPTGSVSPRGARAREGLTDAEVVRRLDREAAVRIAAPPLRETSRRLGRQLARAGARCWPAAVLAVLVDELPEGAHLPVAFGAVGVAAGLDAAHVARLVVHHAVTTPAQAALRLLGLDPFEVVALTARLGATVGDEVVVEALTASTGALADLPARGSPLVDLAALDHRRWDVRLFAS